MTENAVSRKRRILKSFIRVLATLAALTVMFFYLPLYFFQDSLIFHPQKLSDEDVRQIAARHPKAEEVRLTAGDGTGLHGWLAKRDGKPERRSGEKSPLIIYFGGNAEEASGMLYEQDAFKGWAMLLMNYRGYGLSGGKPSEKGITSDAPEVYDYASGRGDIEASRIVLMGRSLGAGVAVGLASKRSVAGVILVSPYDSLASVGRKLYPFAPVGLMLRHKFDVGGSASSIKAPLLAIIAEKDKTIPPDVSMKLFEAWGGPKSLVVINGADHNSVDANAEYWRAVSDFLSGL